MKPLGEFLRRTGRRSGKHGRRGTCRACRKTAMNAPSYSTSDRPLTVSAEETASTAAGAVSLSVTSPAKASPKEDATAASVLKKRPRKRRRSGGAHKRQDGAAEQHAPQPKREKEQPPDVSFLKPTKLGFIRMRGKTDNGRRWYQEIEPELAYILVKEGAAVVVNRHTIRRLYSNKEFRQFILTRDQYTCRFCGQYGDTIDHELPRSKGGHTTPANCVCACYACNQRKASRDVDEFISAIQEESLE
ncbi:HNH endonuclease [Paenibacillus nanensis]|uniref:HNH endonuclease n=2 Tax=Paenibacillus nanensis TaxID=393251 RepID=A0A3A1UWC2_9BACL|nr:HNH endonuclease [Paenibacillus nanensis]